MEEGSQSSLMKHVQKEQELERRRIRDRQRRQSMTLEEREKHLARRRRNYHLRRQRAENARSLSAAPSDYHHLQCNGLDIPAHKLAQLPSRLRLNHVKHLARSLDDHASLPLRGDETADSDCAQLKGMRLNRVKRLARSLTSGLEKFKQEDNQSKIQG